MKFLYLNSLDIHEHTSSTHLLPPTLVLNLPRIRNIFWIWVILPPVARWLRKQYFNLTGMAGHQMSYLSWMAVFSATHPSQVPNLTQTPNKCTLTWRQAVPQPHMSTSPARTLHKWTCGWGTNMKHDHFTEWKTKKKQSPLVTLVSCNLRLRKTPTSVISNTPTAEQKCTALVLGRGTFFIKLQ